MSIRSIARRGVLGHDARMKKLLRIVLVLIAAAVGMYTKSQLGEDEAQQGGSPTIEAPGDQEVAASGSSRSEPPKSVPAAPPRTTPEADPEPEATPPSTGVDRRGESAIMNAFNAKRSDVQINFTGRVKFTLPDDNDPPRHQNWIMELSNGHTIKVSHNTDLAPYVKGLSKGDTVTVFGEYEYEERGGVIHWTHHDPGRRHIGGYIQYKGEKYE
jgi:hypothetical protein